MYNVSPEALAIIGGYHADPFRYLGSHFEHGTHVVRTFLTGAREVHVRFKDDQEAELKRIHDSGLFVGPVPSGARDYRLKVRWHDADFVEFEDPYRFSTVLSVNRAASIAVIPQSAWTAISV